MDDKTLIKFKQKQTQQQRLSEEKFKFEPSQIDPELLRGCKFTSFDDDVTKGLKAISHIVSKTNTGNYDRLLPAIFSLKGRPYSLQNHFPMRTMFRTVSSKKTCLIAGRQVSKSTVLAAEGIMTSNLIPFFTTLYVTPLFEMVRRLSQNYVRPFIETSPLRKSLVNVQAVKSVLQRSFRNRSSMIFSFAFLDANRTRGVPTDRLVIDELQNLNKEFVPIIRESLSGSDYGLELSAGTPLTRDNAIEMFRQDSSQAEWVMKCRTGGCGHWNVPYGDDLLKMIGKPHRNISEKCPGIVCAKCQKPLFPRDGHWHHFRKEMRWTFDSYHLPQIIFPGHYGSPSKWAELFSKMHGAGNMTHAQFMNEVLGVSEDVGSKLVTMEELQSACVLDWSNTRDQAIRHIDDYPMKCLAIDWGGGGQKETSFTTMAVLGLRPDGNGVDVIFGIRSLTPLEKMREAKLAITLFKAFECDLMAHDYNGAGSSQEDMLIQGGMPRERVMPISYLTVARSGLMIRKPATAQHPRTYWQLDKARSLRMTCELIRTKQIRFFKWDWKSAHDRGLIYDFLGLIEEKRSVASGRDMYVIDRALAQTDDFAHSVNLGAHALWSAVGRWPDVKNVVPYAIDQELWDALEAEDMWSEFLKSETQWTKE